MYMMVEQIYPPWHGIASHAGAVDVGFGLGVKTPGFEKRVILNMKFKFAFGVNTEHVGNIARHPAK